MTPQANRMKQLYCNTLLDLAEKHPLDKITATMVIREAGTARQTFYNHFMDINDLISYLPINYLAAKSGGGHNAIGVRAAYEYALEHKAFFRQLPRHQGQNNFRASFVKAFEDLYAELYIPEEADEKTRLRRKLAINLSVGGVTSLFLEWCATDFAWPLEDLVLVQEALTPAFMRTGNPVAEEADLAVLPD